MSNTNTFKIGDTVVLKSGGPVMTVKGPHRNLSTRELIGYYCQWFAGKKLEQGEFPVDSLKAAPSEPKAP